MRFWLLALLSMVISGCITPYESDPPDSVELLSNYPILRLDGNPVQDPYRVLMSPGEHEIEIQFKTYSNEPICHFVLDATDNTRYEVTDSGDEFPLTLYRWVYVNKLWSRRTAPLNPLSCN